MDKILTITVPTYNMASYLDECLSSLIYEDFMESLEVLIVNDGSTDNSSEVAQQYADRYPQTFKLINKENGGHGSTINKGIELATGKYFKVLDADDWFDLEAFKYLMLTLMNNDSDLVVSNYYWVDDEKRKKKEEIKYPFKKVIYERKYDFCKVAKDIFIKMHALTIKTSLLKENGINIDENCFYVDMEFVLYPIRFVKTVTFINKHVYMYRLGRPGQSMDISQMQKQCDHHQQVLSSLLKTYRFWQAEQVSEPYIDYLVKGINRMIVSQFKIYLSYPINSAIKKEMGTFDIFIKQNHPEIYNRMNNYSIKLLRCSRFYLYPLASYLMKQKKW